MITLIDPEARGAAFPLPAGHLRSRLPILLCPAPSPLRQIHSALIESVRSLGHGVGDVEDACWEVLADIWGALSEVRRARNSKLACVHTCVCVCMFVCVSTCASARLIVLCMVQLLLMRGQAVN